MKPGPASVPWSVAERAWAAYSVRYGRDQSVERLAQRGGFFWGEMDSLFPGWSEATDEWVQLRKELAAARAVLEQAKADRREAQAREHDAHSELDKVQGLLRLAERERDEARDDLALAEAHMVEERNARERAEADNAVLLDALRKTHPWYAEACSRCERAEAVIKAEHPGAALLHLLAKNELAGFLKGFVDCAVETVAERLRDRLLGQAK